MTVTMEHLIKYLNKKMAPRSYGSVLIHFRNGEVTGITEKIDYNPDSFIETVNKPLIPVIVRSCKKKLDSKPDEKLTDMSENSGKVVNLTKNTSQTGSKLAGDKE